MAYDAGNPGTGLGQVQTCGGAKLVNGFPVVITMWIEGIPVKLNNMFDCVQIFAQLQMILS